MKIRIIGDVHAEINGTIVNGNLNRYLQLCLSKDVDYSIQLGDLSNSYDFFKEVINYGMSPEKHKFIGGNHDNWDILTGENKPPHFLGRYGVFSIPDSYLNIFYISGAKSIDAHRRILGYNLFYNEELSYTESENCYKLYNEVQPDLLLCHDGAEKIVRKLYPYITVPSTTRTLIQECVELHPPQLVIFGHHHPEVQKVFVEMNKTTHINIPLLDNIDLEL